MKTYYSASLIADINSYLADLPSPMFECDGCKGDIYPGDRYCLIGDNRYCADCVRLCTAGEDEE